MVTAVVQWHSAQTAAYAVECTGLTEIAGLDNELLDIDGLDNDLRIWANDCASSAFIDSLVRITVLKASCVLRHMKFTLIGYIFTNIQRVLLGEFTDIKMR